MKGVIESNEVGGLLRSYERAMGLTCCFRPLSLVWHQPAQAVTGRMALHLSPFCVPIRATQMPACVRCDLTQLHTLFAKPARPTVRTCHAGADEILIPVHHRNQPVLVVFFGQFRRHADQPASLPLWAEARVKNALNLADALRSHLSAIYRHRLAQRPAPSDPRLARVIQWLDSRLAQDPSLDDLATFLCVSPTWASHLIRQRAGQSFTQIKDELRIQRARDLLAGTPLKISGIGRQLGMRDAGYFSRFFKNKTGMTATEYRRIHQLPQQV